MEASEGLLAIRDRLMSWYPATGLQGTTWTTFVVVERDNRAVKVSDHQPGWLVEFRDGLSMREKIFATPQSVFDAVRNWLG